MLPTKRRRGWTPSTTSARATPPSTPLRYPPPRQAALFFLARTPATSPFWKARVWNDSRRLARACVAGARALTFFFDAAWAGGRYPTGGRALSGRLGGRERVLLRGANGPRARALRRARGVRTDAASHTPRPLQYPQPALFFLSFFLSLFSSERSDTPRPNSRGYVPRLTTPTPPIPPTRARTRWRR